MSIIAILARNPIMPEFSVRVTPARAGESGDDVGSSHLYQFSGF